MPIEQAPVGFLRWAYGSFSKPRRIIEPELRRRGLKTMDVRALKTHYEFLGEAPSRNYKPRTKGPERPFLGTPIPKKWIIALVELTQLKIRPDITREREAADPPNRPRPMGDIRRLWGKRIIPEMILKNLPGKSLPDPGIGLTALLFKGFLDSRPSCRHYFRFCFSFLELSSPRSFSVCSIFCARLPQVISSFVTSSE